MNAPSVLSDRDAYLDAYWECWHLMSRRDSCREGTAILRRIRWHLADWAHTSRPL